jgi:hypothetical protein
LLAIMPMLDDVDIAPMQRGDQSRDVVIPGLGGLGGAVGGHSHRGIPAGGGTAGSRSGAPAGGRGGAAGGSSAAALCRSGYGKSLASGRRRAMRRPQLTRRPWTRGLRRKAKPSHEMRFKVDNGAIVYHWEF